MYFKAKKENAEDKLWQRWLVDFARMNHENFISFQDYKDKTFNKSGNKTVLNKEEILKDAEDIKKLDQKGGI